MCEEVEIRRIWHFNSSGEYRPQEEQVHIFKGITHKPVNPTGSQGDARLDWYRDYIARTFLPSSQAVFFLFDGEQVSAFAEHDMAAQGRTGIEGLLGIPILKELAEDLRKYDRARRQGSMDVPDTTIETLEREHDQLKDQLNERRNRFNEIWPKIHKFREQQDQLQRELASYGAGSQAQTQEQMDQRNQHRRAVDDGRAQLEAQLAGDIALALSGRDLRQRLTNRLKSEQVRETWEQGKKQGDSNLEQFLGAVGQGMGAIDPILSPHQYAAVLDTARTAWNQIWNPPPDDCAETWRHPYLGQRERDKVIDRLNELGAPGIVNLLHSIDENEKQLKRVNDELNRTEVIAPTVDKKRAELSSLNDQIGTLNQEIGELRRELDSLDGQIKQKNNELYRLSGKRDQSKPAVRRATRALKVATLVDEIVARAVPNQIRAIEQEMTRAHHAMAHKKDLVARIEIDQETCDVQLLNRDGLDIRNYDLSAGEKQIFTQALI
ncbi:MAG: DNA sulfur modification protein DndD, partial [Rhodobacteraceae bacterium]|nr:DNA sulfur modification protein DndD [Paracoccaceae bacterium]